MLNPGGITQRAGKMSYRTVSGHLVLKMEANSAILFRQDLLHQGSGFKSNLRLFRYFDIEFLPRSGNTETPVCLSNKAMAKPREIAYVPKKPGPHVKRSKGSKTTAF